MKLTARQEAAYLMKILNGEYSKIDHGSSRAVYDMEDGRVVKLALEPEGRVQNEVEIDMYNNFGDTFLARIYEYGDSIVIMEKVDVHYKEISSLDYHSLCEFDMAEYYEFTESEIEDYFETVRFLDLELGETADNSQVGFRYRTGTFVAYDYGYTQERRNESVGSIYQLLRDKETFSTAVNGVIQMLKSKEEAQCKI